jgi:hypothetical protein
MVRRRSTVRFVARLQLSEIFELVERLGVIPG